MYLLSCFAIASDKMSQNGDEELTTTGLNVDTEELRLLIDDEILKIQQEKLREFATSLTINVEGKNLRIVRRLITKFVDAMEDDQLTGLLNDLRKFNTVEEPKETPPKETPPKETPPKETPAPTMTEDAIKTETSAFLEGTSGKRDLQTLLGFRREFRIKGVIGEVGHKEGLSLMSLNRQGLSRGYTEEEVIHAVINAVSPSVHLRTLLESSPGLTLPKLRVFLQSHFLEKNTTELCQALTCLTQDKESDIEFVYKAMSLRQRIILASNSPEADISYNAELVQKIFLKAIETGMKSSSVVSEVRPLLRQPDVSDEELITAVSQASQANTERNIKHHTSTNTKHSAKVNNLDVDVETESNIGRILSTLSEELISLKKEVRQLKSNNGERSAKSRQQHRRVKLACEPCMQKNLAASCTHCAVCESPDHFARQCPHKTSSENSKRLGK